MTHEKALTDVPQSSPRVLKAATGELINTTEKSPTHTTPDAMIIRLGNQ